MRRGTLHFRRSRSAALVACMSFALGDAAAPQTAGTGSAAPQGTLE